MKPRFSLISIVALAVIATASAASASESGDERAPLRTYAVEGTAEIALADASEISDAIIIRGTDDVSADDPLLWQNEFNEVVTDIQIAFPDDYSSSAIDTEAGTASVAFAAAAPAQAIALLNSLPTRIEVKEGVGWSEVDIATLGEKVHRSVLSQTDLFEDVYTSTNAATGRIDVFAELLDTATVKSAANALGQTASRNNHMNQYGSGDGLQDVATTYQVVDDLDGSLDALYGGGKLVSSTAGVCTAGFPVKNTIYANGLMTAAHCSNSLSYGTIGLSFRSASSSRDIQWHSAGGTTVGKRFYVGDTTLRDFISTANPSSGTSVCKYGRTTKTTCDKVSVLNQCRSNWCGLAATLHRRAAPGDSGGPWYYGNTGYGIHSGRISLSGADRDVFTPLRSSLDTLNVTPKLAQ